MRRNLLHHFRHFRAHQLATYGNSGLHVEGVDQRQFTGGGAAYGCHAYAAFNSARAHIYFLDRLAKDVAEHKKRSKAAKKAWQARREAA